MRGIWRQFFDASHVTQEEILAAAMTVKDEDLKEGA